MVDARALPIFNQKRLHDVGGHVIAATTLMVAHPPDVLMMITMTGLFADRRHGIVIIRIFIDACVNYYFQAGSARCSPHDVRVRLLRVTHSRTNSLGLIW